MRITDYDGYPVFLTDFDIAIAKALQPLYSSKGVVKVSVGPNQTLSVEILELPKSSFTGVAPRYWRAVDSEGLPQSLDLKTLRGQVVMPHGLNQCVKNALQQKLKAQSSSSLHMSKTKALKLILNAVNFGKPFATSEIELDNDRDIYFLRSNVRDPDVSIKQAFAQFEAKKREDTIAHSKAIQDNPGMSPDERNSLETAVFFHLTSPGVQQGAEQSSFLIVSNHLDIRCLYLGKKPLQGQQSCEVYIASASSKRAFSLHDLLNALKD